MLKRSKKNNLQEDWVKAYYQAWIDRDNERSERLIQKAINRIPADKENCICGWSGGKDALAMQVICERAGVSRYVMGTIGEKWEYPSFVRYCREHMPIYCTIRDAGITADYLNAHPSLVFPETSKDAYAWYKICNQSAYYSEATDKGYSHILLGHRTADGNVCADRKGKIYPIADFSHEDIFCILACNNIELPGIYFYKDGFRNGTHAWVMRYGGISAMDELWEIDKDLLLLNREIKKIDQYLTDKGV